MEQDGYKIAAPQAPQRLTRGEQNNAAPQAPPGKTREQEVHVLHCVMRQPFCRCLCCAVRHFLLCFIALYGGSIMISVLLFECSSSDPLLYTTQRVHPIAHSASNKAQHGGARGGCDSVLHR
eukprot:gene16127-biopygen12785